MRPCPCEGDFSRAEDDFRVINPLILDFSSCQPSRHFKVGLHFSDFCSIDNFFSFLIARPTLLLRKAAQCSALS